MFPPRGGDPAFSLVELVLVITVIATLSAVAVPRYFEMQAAATQRAVDGIHAEVQARVNLLFAQRLLGDPPATAPQACEDANNIVVGDVNADLGGWAIAGVWPGTPTYANANLGIAATAPSNPAIVLPTCN